MNPAPDARDNKVTPETHPELETSPFPCIVCGRVLCNVLPRDITTNQPYEAATFTSHGHYGCTVFDDFDGATLEINVCDGCLTAARNRGHVGYRPGIPRRALAPWTDQ
jgi:hypothetical protein